MARSRRRALRRWSSGAHPHRRLQPGSGARHHAPDRQPASSSTRPATRTRPSVDLEFNLRNPLVRQARCATGDAAAVDRNFIANTIYYGSPRRPWARFSPAQHAFFTPDAYRLDSTRRRQPRCSTRRAIRRQGTVTLHGQPGGRRLVRRERQDRRVREAGARGHRHRGQPQVPDRPTSIKRIYTDYDFDMASPTTPSRRAGPLADAVLHDRRHQEGRALPQCLGYSNPEMDALV